MDRFYSYITSSRLALELKQEDFCEKLSNFDDEFKSVSPQTISRWENDGATPSEKRIKLLIEFFGDQELIHYSRFITTKCSRRLQINSSIRYVMDNIIGNIKSPNIVGNQPFHSVQSKWPITSLREMQRSQRFAFLEYLRDFTISIAHEDKRDTIEEGIKGIENYILSNLNSTIVCTNQMGVAGHLTTFHLNSESYDKVGENPVLISSLSDSDRPTIGKKNSVVIVNMHSINSYVLARLVSKLKYSLIRNKDEIEFVGIYPCGPHSKELSTATGIPMLGEPAKRLEDIISKEQTGLFYGAEPELMSSRQQDVFQQRP